MNSVPFRVNLLFPFYAVVLRFCCHHLVRQSCLLRSVMKTVVLKVHVPPCLPPFQKLNPTTKLVIKVVIDYNYSEVCGSDFFPLVVLRNCQSEFIYTLANLFNI